jgi:putative ABC transport system ATP-binding protein
MLNVSDRVVWIRDGRVDKVENREELSISIGQIGSMD